jgi:hypothetical protein
VLTSSSQVQRVFKTPLPTEVQQFIEKASSDHSWTS